MNLLFKMVQNNILLIPQFVESFDDYPEIIDEFVVTGIHDIKPETDLRRDIIFIPECIDWRKDSFPDLRKPLAIRIIVYGIPHQ